MQSLLQSDMLFSPGWILSAVILGAVLIAVPVYAAVNITTEGLLVTDSGYAGGAITVIEVVKNSGEDPSGPVTISYYLVNETGVNASPVPIGTTDLESIASGGDYSSVKTFLLPLDVADGAYRFVRKVMGSESTYEPGKTIRITDPKPGGAGADLVGSGVIFPGQAGPGDEIRVITAVENRGGSDAGRFTIDYYLTNRSAVAPEPLLLGSWNVESVPAGGQASTTRSFKVPGNVASGNYGVLMDVDPQNEVSEADESNNDWYREGMIEILGKAPDVIRIPVMINSTSSIVIIPVNNTSLVQTGNT